MKMKWAPKKLDALFCDGKDHLGIYYWYNAILEDHKFRLMGKNETMTVTYQHTI